MNKKIYSIKIYIRGEKMRFKGSNKQLKTWFDTLISIYGSNAKIADIERSVRAVRGKEV